MSETNTVAGPLYSVHFIGHPQAQRKGLRLNGIRQDGLRLNFNLNFSLSRRQYSLRPSLFFSVPEAIMYTVPLTGHGI